MTNPKIDREAMGRLAKALAFICGPDHPTTMALKSAAVSGSDQDVKKARALFWGLARAFVRPRWNCLASKCLKGSWTVRRAV